MHKLIPTKFLDILPLPIIVVELNENNHNHNNNIIYLNPSFSNIIGWSLQEIPDNDHWWHKAFPDPSYQRVVESIWELSMESIDSDNDSFVTITVNIMTKYHGVKRFNVHTEIKSALADGYYVITLEEVNESA